MKTLLLAGLLSLSLVAPVYAGCGACGMDHGKESDAGTHAGKMCPMHGEKNATLIEAADALEKSHPELAKELKHMADHCCGGH